jgi:hypothetical protein
MSYDDLLRWSAISWPGRLSFFCLLRLSNPCGIVAGYLLQPKPWSDRHLVLFLWLTSGPLLGFLASDCSM